MKAAFITCLVCALMSIVAILGLSVMDIAPGIESWHDVNAIAMLVSTVFFLVWIGLAFWLRPKPDQTPWPRWARALVISAGVVYVLGVLLPVVG